MIPAQCRAARALLNWSQATLSAMSGLGIVTVRQFEAGIGAPRNATVEALMSCFEAVGVEFLAGGGAGPGVRLKQPLDPQSEFLVFLKQYEHARLRAKARQVRGLPEFGYAFVYHNRDGADLMYRGQWLGKVRWREDTAVFDPPLPPDVTPEVTEQVLDQWVVRSEYRAATGS